MVTPGSRPTAEKRLKLRLFMRSPPLTAENRGSPPSLARRLIEKITITTMTWKRCFWSAEGDCAQLGPGELSSYPAVSSIALLPTENPR
jgi:hypothetical protein